MMWGHDTRCKTLGLVAGILALTAVACSAPPPARAPIQMVKIETSPGAGRGEPPPLALHSKIPATTSANDLESGPKLSEPPKERKNDPKFANPENHVGLTKHETVSVGGNVHGFSR